MLKRTVELPLLLALNSRCPTLWLWVESCSQQWHEKPSQDQDKAHRSKDNYERGCACEWLYFIPSLAFPCGNDGQEILNWKLDALIETSAVQMSPGALPQSGAHLWSQRPHTKKWNAPCSDASSQSGSQQAQSNLMIWLLSGTYSFYYGSSTLQEQIIRLDISSKNCRII